MELSFAIRIIILITGTLSLATVQSTMPSSACTFQLVGNRTSVDNVIQYFHHENYATILEFYLNFINVGADFDLEKLNSTDSYRLKRWFCTQGVISSKLLHLYNYYYDSLKPFIANGVKEITVDLVVTPQDCFSFIRQEGLEQLIRDYLFPCECCGYDCDNSLYCHYVNEDFWPLHAFIWILTIFLCLYMPNLIPRGYKLEKYSYNPEMGLKLNIVLTRTPERYSQNKSAVIVQSRNLRTMNRFVRDISKFDIDTIYNVHVDKFDLLISEEKIIIENGPTINTFETVFNAFVRCKSNFLKGCHNTHAYGKYWFHMFSTESAWSRVIKNILVMTFFALPSIPFMYAMCTDKLDYQNLLQAFIERGLISTFDFYSGQSIEKVIVRFVACMYVLIGIVFILHGSSSQRLNKLHSKVLKEQKKRKIVCVWIQSLKKIIQKVCLIVKKFGNIFIPFWILPVIISPFLILVTFFIQTPMVQVAVRVFRENVLQNRIPKDGPRFVMQQLFCITSVFLIIVLAVGTNFLFHLLTISILINLEADFFYYTMPFIFILLIYMYDSYSSIGKQFDAFLYIIFNIIRKKELQTYRKECFKPSSLRKNTIFQIPLDKKVQTVVSILSEEHELDKSEQPSPLIVLKDEQLCFRMKQCQVFLDKENNLYISKKFLFHCSTVDCTGAPGMLRESYIHASWNFFLMSMFGVFPILVIFAFGPIPPNNYLYKILVTGFIPLILKYTGESRIQTLNTSSFRFQSKFKEKVQSFSEDWTVEDIVLKSHTIVDDIDYASEASFDLLITINDDFSRT